MRLVFGIKSMDDPGGGAERVIAAVTGGLARRGHELTLLTFDPPGGTSFYPLHPAIRRVSLGIGHVSRQTRWTDAARRTLVLRAAIRRTSPDVAVGFMNSMFVPMGLALSGTGIPLIGSEHIAYDHYASRPVQRALWRLVPRTTVCVTVISDALRSSAPRWLQSHLVVVPNPVAAYRGPLTDVTGRPEGRKRLLTVGRLSPQKDHATLLSAFGKVAQEAPEWDLRIVGDGPLRSSLERQRDALGLGARVEFAGFTRDIDREYANAHCFVLASRYESFGLVTAEALSHGLPALGFADCPGTNEIITNDENGVLVSGPDRIEALASGLRALLSDPAKRVRLGAAGPASIHAYSLEGVLDRWEEVLHSAMRSTIARGQRR